MSDGVYDEMPTFRIDGAAFADIEGFYDEVESKLLADRPWDRSLEALDALLDEPPPPLPRTFRLVWEHADLSRRQLGADGPGSFTDLIERIARHGNVELILS